MKKFLSFCAALLVAFAANATVFNITNETPDTLRITLAAANDGDEIVMAEGTYVESNGNYIAFAGKHVTVKAAEGKEVIIQPQVPITVSEGGCAHFKNVKIDASRLTELANWYEHLIYAADDNANNSINLEGCELYGFNLNKSMIFCSNSANEQTGLVPRIGSITINNCYIHNIEKSVIFIENSSNAINVQITNSTFANVIANVTTSYYAGIIDLRASSSQLLVDHCTFYNVKPMNTDYSAVSKITLANGTASNCIFMLPEATDGIRAMRGVTATNCITYNYQKDDGTGIHSSVTQNNCVQQNPLFVDAANGNFKLGEGSPALTMNNGEAIGDPRWNVEEEEEPAEPLRFYLKLSDDWAGYPAKYAIYYFKHGVGDGWSDWMTAVENETNLYTATIPADNDTLIFVRLDKDAAEINWENKWSQTVDLAIPEDDNDMFTVTAGSTGSACTGEWSKYVYVAPAKFYITGSNNLVGGEGWKANDIKVTEDSYTFKDLPAGNYKLKITLDGTWATSKGSEQLSEASSYFYPDPDKNVCFTLAETGDVTVTYIAGEPETFTVVGNFSVPAVKIYGQGDAFGDWDGENPIVFTPNENELTASKDFTLAAGTYAFKMVRGMDYLTAIGDNNTNYGLHREWTHTSDFVMDGEGKAALQLTADIDGVYTFTWTYADNTLTITFPATDPTAIDNAAVEMKAMKVIRDGQMLIIRDGKTFNAMGTEL